jgi:hypothetical protein
MVVNGTREPSIGKKDMSCSATFMVHPLCSVPY